MKHLLGFPSSFAALKWLDANADGLVSYRLNGNPNIQHYDPEFRAEDLGQRYADSCEYTLW